MSRLSFDPFPIDARSRLWARLTGARGASIWGDAPDGALHLIDLPDIPELGDSVSWIIGPDKVCRFIEEKEG